ncbi:MAG: response regulator transcription factor [Candidatus Omnitrophota bacterium]|nr:response regulator transcription factor [Candidatus Omnitrophota bacterium]
MPEKILLVDDDDDFRSEFKDCFSEYEIIESASGEEALRVLRRPNEIDLVILDIKLPGLNGTEVLREIRKTNPGLGIIILTGYSSKDTAIEALRGRADDYIEKPFDIEIAKKVIENLLEFKKSGPNTDASDIKSKLERVKRFIRRNALKRISLNDAAEIAYLSPKYLSRVFKEDTGVGFSEYRLLIKIDEAIKLLTKTQYNISQIADRLGYTNTESFIRQFKKHTGFTPKGYRNEHKKTKKTSRSRKR